MDTQISYVVRGSFINRRFGLPDVEHNAGRYEARNIAFGLKPMKSPSLEASGRSSV
jgi:hypothetical protein